MEIRRTLAMPGAPETPIVSVIMPVHNAAAHLSQAVESILRQTLHRLELIAVDDGSEDGSGAILDHAARCDERLRVFHLPHQGLVRTLNSHRACPMAKLSVRTRP